MGVSFTLFEHLTNLILAVSMILIFTFGHGFNQVGMATNALHDGGFYY